MVQYKSLALEASFMGIGHLVLTTYLSGPDVDQPVVDFFNQPNFNFLGSDFLPQVYHVLAAFGKTAAVKDSKFIFAKSNARNFHGDAGGQPL